MSIPLYGFVKGDTIGLLILADENDTVADLAAKLVSAASVRVAPRSGARVIYKGKVLESTQSLAEVGLGSLERFDVDQGEL